LAAALLRKTNWRIATFSFLGITEKCYRRWLLFSQAVFNADWTGLFWKRMPMRTYTSEEEKMPQYSRQQRFK
jgi:hypothetical protein